MLEIRTLEPRDIPWSALDAFEDRVVFQTRAWLEFIADSQRARPVVAEIRDGDAVAGYFSGLVVRKFGVRILGSSFPGWTTPYIGFNLMPGYSRSQMLEPLVRWAFRELRCIHVEVSDCHFLPTDGGAGQLDRSAYDQMVAQAQGYFWRSLSRFLPFRD